MENFAGYTVTFAIGLNVKLTTGARDIDLLSTTCATLLIASCTTRFIPRAFLRVSFGAFSAERAPCTMFNSGRSLFVVMIKSQVRVFQCRLLSLLISVGTFLVVLEPASAQLSKDDKQRIATMIAAEINRAMAKHETERIPFREKVIGRLAQCGSLFLKMSATLNDAEAKMRIHTVGEISFQIGVLVSEGIAVNRFKELVNAASKAVDEKFAAPRTRDSEREMDMLLENCASFHSSLQDIPNAVAELLPGCRSGVGRN